jgi:hypothetical protein
MFFLALPQKEPKNASPSKAPPRSPARTSLDGQANPQKTSSKYQVKKSEETKPTSIHTT